MMSCPLMGHGMTVRRLVVGWREPNAKHRICVAFIQHDALTEPAIVGDVIARVVQQNGVALRIREALLLTLGQRLLAWHRVPALDALAPAPCVAIRRRITMPQVRRCCFLFGGGGGSGRGPRRLGCRRGLLEVQQPDIERWIRLAVRQRDAADWKALVCVPVFRVMPNDAFTRRLVKTCTFALEKQVVARQRGLPCDMRRTMPREAIRAVVGCPCMRSVAIVFRSVGRREPQVETLVDLTCIDCNIAAKPAVVLKTIFCVVHDDGIARCICHAFLLALLQKLAAWNRIFAFDLKSTAS
mmetsp:Transcript_51435/g.165213  ORF Transcript_51435/g.165213 Transcript_51435/m.165213 type:complete len:298 (-) Transcript_51435:2558-3451(-)